jgi:hypothetical protein
MDIGTRSKERGIFAARQFGAEHQANPGSSRREYLDSSAYYFRDGVESFSQLTDEEKEACRSAFQKGVAAERLLQ